MINKIVIAVLAFFFATILIYISVRLLLEIWWVLTLLAIVVIAIIIVFRVRKNHNRW